MKDVKSLEGNVNLEYRDTDFGYGFKVIEVNVADSTESLPALVNPVKINVY
jgi:hypothetical protein